MNAFLFGQDKTMCKMSAYYYVAFNEVTHGPTYIKRDNDKNLDACHY